jgi:hypothetical protein
MRMVGRVSRYTPGGYLLASSQNPDELIRQRGLRWYKKIAADPQVFASLDLLYAAVSSCWNSAAGQIPSAEEWEDLLASISHLPPQLQAKVLAQTVEVSAPQIVPPKDPTPMELKATEFARYTLDEFLGRNRKEDSDITGRDFGRVVEETLSCIEDGKACLELEWQKIPDGPWKGKWGINDFLWRYPEFFTFDDNNKLWMKEWLGSLEGTIPVPSNKVVLASFHPKYENYHGQSILHSLSFATDLKWNSESMCAISEERFGMPTVVGWTDTRREGMSTDDLLVMLEKLQRGQSMTLNQDEKGHIEDVQFMETSRRGGSSEYDVTIRRNNRYTSKVLLGSALALEEGDNGSLALAAATAKPNFRWKIRRLIKLVNWVHSTQTLAWMTFYNFPAGTRPPRCQIRLTGDISQFLLQASSPDNQAETEHE